MSTRPNPKRARQKDRRNQRRDEWMREYRRRRRNRLTLIFITLVVLIVAGTLGFFRVTRTGFFAKPTKTHAAATPIPSATPDLRAVVVPKKTPVACDASVPPSAGSIKKKYTEALDQHLDPNKTYTWKLQTSCGEVDIALDVKRSPKTANSIIFLTKQGFYDGTFFHRIAPDFVIHGGDPVGDGTGGSGYKVTEPVPSGFKYTAGTVAMAKGGAEASGTSGSQFFIVLSDKGGSGLTPDYAEIGSVSSGMDVVTQVAATGTADFQPPKAWTYIEKATIVEE